MISLVEFWNPFKKVPTETAQERTSRIFGKSGVAKKLVDRRNQLDDASSGISGANLPKKLLSAVQER